MPRSCRAAHGRAPSLATGRRWKWSPRYKVGDVLTIADRTYTSRLILGTGFPTLDLLETAISATGAQLVTLALRRVDAVGRTGLVDVLDRAKVDVLPNTAGCFTARDAVVTAKLAREAFGTDWIKLEVIGDERTDRKSTRLNSSHANISYAVFCLKKKKTRLPAYPA